MSYLQKYFRGIIATKILREVGHVKTINSQSIRVLETDHNEDVTECSGTVAKPTDGGTGYAVGCEYIDTDASTGSQIYVNGGTNTSCLFSLLQTASILNIGDVSAGGASNGSIVKKTLQAGEAYTGTTAGLMVKNYGTDGTETVPSGEFCGLYVNIKGLHTDPGNNTSLISAHVHASNTTVVHAGLWIYGDMTNGVKASDSTLTSMLDVSEATKVTNLIDLPAAATDTILEANTNTTPANCTHIIRCATQTSTPIYLLGFTSKPT